MAQAGRIRFSSHRTVQFGEITEQLRPDLDEDETEFAEAAE